jgi:CheY-like chemotaxis protein
MIYLFDDKKNRQLDFGWDAKSFQQFEDFIKPIYLYKEIEENNIREKMFSSNNIILFHESFFDNILNKQDKTALEIRERLNKLTKSTNDYKVVYFSGSKNSRKLEDNIGYIPVSILYQNLGVFIAKLKDGDENLNYLLFGENYKIEEFLLNKIILSNNEIEDSISNGNPASKNFIALTLQNEIETVFENAKYETFYLDENQNNEITDEYLTKVIEKWFSNQSYYNIFIPLCFGPTLSDYNGLRFALHIRCTESPNRLANIFIYSAVNYSLLVDNEYFDVLKTKNVNLIGYKKTAFQMAVESNRATFNKSELASEIKKIKLDPPKNYEDGHSIANEWAIYLWSSAINTSDSDINRIIGNVNNQLYFKYLKTVNTIHKIPNIKEDQLKINYSGSPKILYIDDEADKGWYEIFCTIIYDINNLKFQYIDGELQGKTREEIIRLSIEEIEKEDIDLILLDFRLHSDDFNTSNLQDITGLKLLREIKKTNPGVRVIIFSATNKVWNLIELQNAGADGFIIKESPDTYVSSSFTRETIEKFSQVLEEQLKYQFLKELFNDCKIIKEILFLEKEDENEEYNKFIKTLLSQINIIKSSLSLINFSKPATLDIVFLSCFNFLELFKTYYLNENKKDYRYYIGFENEVLISYNVLYRSNKLENNGEWLPNERMRKPTWFNTIAALFIDYFKVSSDPFLEVIKLSKIAELRNDYIHNSKEHFTVEELKLIFSSLVLATSKIKE